MGGALRRIAIHGVDLEQCREVARVHGLNHHDQVDDLSVSGIDANPHMQDGQRVEDQYFFVVGDKLRLDPVSYSAVGIVEDEGMLWSIHESAPDMPLIFWTSQLPLPEFDWKCRVLVLPWMSHIKSGSTLERMNHNQFHFKHSRSIRAYLDQLFPQAELIPHLEFWEQILGERFKNNK